MSERPRIVEGKLWRQEWLRAPSDRRLRVDTAVRAGSALQDPADAALAVGLAVQRRTTATWWLVAAAGFAVVFIGFATREGGSSALAGLAVLPLIGAGFAHKARGKALRAELQNREVVYDALAKSAPAPAAEPVADPWADLPPPVTTLEELVAGPQPAALAEQPDRAAEQREVPAATEGEALPGTQSEMPREQDAGS